MTEKFENNLERNPNEREVLNVMEAIVGTEFTLVQRLEDESGIYVLDIETVDEVGEKVQYQYIRAGTYPGGYSSAETVIDVVYFVGDMPVGGRPVKKYIQGEWIDF
jgi:hypothetical protein